MDVLHVSLFGRFDVRHGDQIPIDLDTRKSQELLSFLLLYRDRPHPREALADLLWADSSASRSKRYLRKTLWQLQSALDSRVDPASAPTLLVEPDWIQLNPDADLWLDVASFEQVCERVRGVPGKELEPKWVAALQGAIDLYRGDLLEGWYQDWCLLERERLQHLYLVMLDKLMGYCEAHLDCEAGVVYGALTLRYDRARERTHRRLMRLHFQAGDRTAALRQYERCAAALDEELGVKPAKRTVALYEQICADRLGRAHVPAPASREAHTSFPLSMLADLRQLQADLIITQQQIQQSIQTIESAIANQYQ